MTEEEKEEEQEGEKQSHVWTDDKGKYSFSINPLLRKVLERGKTLVNEDWDFIGLYDGYEGSGKSVKCMQDMYYLDQNFSNKSMAFTADEFTKLVRDAKMYQAIQYDEAFSGLNSRGTMSVINKALVRMLAEIRQKRLKIGIVMPTFFDLDKYAALWRSRYLVSVYTRERDGKDNIRGAFAFFDRERKKYLYMNGKKTYEYNVGKPNFRGTFSNYYTVDEAEYKKLKLRSLGRTGDDSSLMIGRDTLVELVVKMNRVPELMALPHRVKIDLVGMKAQTYFSWLRKYEKGEIGT